MTKSSGRYQVTSFSVLDRLARVNPENRSSARDDLVILFSNRNAINRQFFRSTLDLPRTQTCLRRRFCHLHQAKASPDLVLPFRVTIYGALGPKWKPISSILKPQPLKREVAVPWLLLYSHWLALALSLCLSVPLAFFKWRLAYHDEELLAIRSLEGTASNVAEQVISTWFYAALGSIMAANFKIALSRHPNITARLERDVYQAFVSPVGYFSVTNYQSSVAMLLRVLPGEREAMERTFFDLYGGNMGSNTSFSIFNRSTGAAVREVDGAQIYCISYITDDTYPSNRANIGNNLYALPARRAMIDLNRQGLLAVTSRAILVTSTAPVPGVVIGAPIFRDPVSGLLTKNRTDELVAVASAGLEVRQVLTGALASMRLSGMVRVFLFDLDGAPGETFLGYFGKQPHPVYDNTTFMTTQSESQIRSLGHFDWIGEYRYQFYERNWKVLVCADDGYFANFHTNFPDFLLGLSLVEPIFAILCHVAIKIALTVLYPKFSSEVKSYFSRKAVEGGAAGGVPGAVKPGEWEG
ncbi:hypothetical protein HDU96_003647 [Phlyctochytrium bullatum]|nr:hypothetical protein HDU96_003647 [Phlyctochytrium bullatum]